MSPSKSSLATWCCYISSKWSHPKRHLLLITTCGRMQWISGFKATYLSNTSDVIFTYLHFCLFLLSLAESSVYMFLSMFAASYTMGPLAEVLWWAHTQVYDRPRSILESTFFCIFLKVFPYIVLPHSGIKLFRIYTCHSEGKQVLFLLVFLSYYIKSS